MLLVVGGLDGAGDMLDSTEVLTPSSSSAGWRQVAGLLPRAMYGVQVAALDNTLYCTGRGMLLVEYDLHYIMQIHHKMGFEYRLLNYIFIIYL